MLKLLFIVLGSISFVLGIVGIFLPILPTTPFLLLSAALFAKSSQKLYDKLLNNKYFGNYIKDFREHKSIPLQTKIFAISLLWITITTSALFFVSLLAVKILMFVIAIGVTIHILSFKTKK